MLIETIIKDTCTWLTPVPDFHLASMDWFNDVADKQEMWPVCLMENVTASEPEVSIIGVHEHTYNVVLFFLHAYPGGDLQDLNHSPAYGGVRHQAVDTMRQLAETMLQVLVQDSRIVQPSKAITGALIKSIYNFMDMNLDGVSLNVSVTLRVGVSCFPRHDGEKPVG